VDVNLSRRQLFLMFGALYFVQGVIATYQTIFFKPHMEDAGVSDGHIAIVASLALLPFVIKWLYGIISDRFSLFGRGHRVPYMQIGLICTAIAFAVAYFVDPGKSFGVLAAMVLTATFFMALFDTTADALAVDVIVPEDHGRVQAFMSGGRAVGLVLLSLVFGVIADAAGYQVIFLVIAALMLVPLAYVTRVHEPSELTPAHSFDRRAFRAMLQPRYLLFALMLVVTWFCFQGIEGLVTLYMTDELGSSISTISWYGTLKGVGMVIGAVGVARIVSRWDRRTAGLVTVIAVAVGGVALSWAGSEKVILVLAVPWGIAVGLQWTTYVTMAMGITDTRIAASMFAILQTMSNIGMGVGETAVAATDSLGYPTVLRTLGLANLVVIPLVFLIARRFAEMWSRSETDLMVEA
jgi:PAT family beta-lactamase induction signal transducer AmpG